MTLNLALALDRKKLGKSILADIDGACVDLYADDPRRHLGASEIGEACSRKLWYKFRWCGFEKHDGRQLRLFNRGHKEEARFEEWLNKAGFNVATRDPATGDQWRISDANGHFGGSLDGIAYLPQKYEIATPFLLEFKTNGTGPGFAKLLSTSCEIAKPQHFDQQSVYGFKREIGYSLYLNICKNDDNIHCEIVKLNLPRGADLIKKAQVIILAQEPPQRISESKAYQDCNWCQFKGPCHEGIPIARNCRSCVNASPIADKAWHCGLYNATLPDDFIAKGCADWKPIA